jgi:hypothetical protein
LFGQSYELTLAQAERFAALSLACVEREFPNKISHVLNLPGDAKVPSALTPAFFGCYDWHSAVHNHWVLVRLLRLFPSGSFVKDAKRALDRNLTLANIVQEIQYIQVEGRESFERPYGLSWVLQLATELKECEVPEAAGWSIALEPLEAYVAARLTVWLSKLTRPVRSGEHTNTAFAMSLMLDYARATQDIAFEELLKATVYRYYLQDRNCPLSYEPSGEDFFSPCLAEADLVRRVMPRNEFADWLSEFLPHIDFEPAEILDEVDGKIGHLIGLDLSRAWMLAGILSQLPSDDGRRPALSDLASHSKEAGLRRLNADHYHGGHWLGSFAVYLLSARSLEHAGK